jgi:DNA end-binding protein Ku
VAGYYWWKSGDVNRWSALHPESPPPYAGPLVAIIARTATRLRVAKMLMPRALKNLDITLGLAVIPVQLFTATSSQDVAFHLLHAKCGSRIQIRLECPIHGIVPREETVRGYEINKDEYVRFEPEDLKALEQASSLALVIDSFVPEGGIDPVYVEDTYYLGAGKNSERGYRVLVRALQQIHRVAVGTFTWRGKTTPVAIRVHPRPGRRDERRGEDQEPDRPRRRL